jgi:cytochrome c oxidase subunit 2
VRAKSTVRNRPLAQMLVIGLVATAIGIPIALVIPWFPAEGSRQAARVHTLYDVLLIASVPIFVLVETVVLFSVWKFRMRPGEENKDGPPIHGHTRLEVLWTALPALLIISLCTYAYTVLRANEDTKKNEMTVNVTTRQFAFEFSYSGASGKTVVSPVLYIPKGQPVVFKLRSLDVVHSFFVPSFSQKLDAVPGITTTLRVTATRIGAYPVECTELCGAGHSLMRSTAYVVDPAKFQSWLASQPASAAPPLGAPPPQAAQKGVPGAGGSSAAGSASSSSGAASTSSASATSVAAGKAVFTGTAGCSGCHTLAAAAATGTTGPDLDVRLRTDCASAASKRIRGATLQQCIHTAITNPYAFIPQGYTAGIMPSTFAQSLTSTQIEALVNFLASVAK